EPRRGRHQALDDGRARDLAVAGDLGAGRLSACCGSDRSRRSHRDRAGLPRAPRARDGSGRVRGFSPRRRGPSRADRGFHGERDSPSSSRDAQRTYRAGPGHHVPLPLPTCGRRASRDRRCAEGPQPAGGDGRHAPAPRERATEPGLADVTPSHGSSELRFGAGLLGHYSRAYPVSRVAELGAFCERLGFDSYWIADQRWMRDVWVSLTATALRTSRIRLGTRVTDPYVRHPALTAVAIASLDELSGGRAILGLGAGGSGFREMGIERKKPVTALREAIELIRRLLAGEGGDYPGELVQFRRGVLE